MEKIERFYRFYRNKNEAVEKLMVRQFIFLNENIKRWSMLMIAV